MDIFTMLNLVSLVSTNYNSMNSTGACDLDQHQTYHHYQCSSTPPLHHRRPRGTRAGVRKQRRIQCVNPRRPTPPRSDRHRELNNLILVQTEENHDTKSKRSLTGGANYSQLSLNEVTMQRENDLTHNMQTDPNHNDLVNVQTDNSDNNILLDNNIRVGCWNSRSSRKKTNDIEEIILDSDFDIFIINETWLAEKGDEAILAEMTPDGYSSKSFPRIQRRGGGLVIIFKKHLQDQITFNDLSNYKLNSFEAFKSVLRCSKHLIRIVSVYRPPDSLKNSFSHFISEFNHIVTDLMKVPSPLIFLGDFNIMCNKPEKPEVKIFLHVLKTHNLTQHVQSPTNNVSKNTIDLVISSPSSKVSNLTVIKCALSDHDILSFLTDFVKTRPKKVTVLSRNYKKIDMNSLKYDISELLANNSNPDIDNLEDQLRSILDTHAPLIERKVTERSCPWFNENIMGARRIKRQKERRWRKTGQIEDKNKFIEARNLLNKAKIEAKQRYFNDKLQNSNIKDFYHTLDIILCKPSSSQLPNYSDQNVKVSNDFLTSFLSKIENIQNGLKDTPLHSCFLSYTGNCPMTHFRPVTQSEVLNLIQQSPTKSCELDALPTSLLKTCLGEMIELITNIINKSLVSGIVPSNFKKAVVRPLLKKENLDRNELTNYRPVSNLSFLSKILEKVVLGQLLQHLKKNNLQEVFQSAYREYHSTETATLKIFNDLLRNADQRHISILTLLDASAAFDCVNHDVLLQRLEMTYGITGQVLTWMRSYMSERTLRVAVGTDYSEQATLTCGVPQGSCLGPILYTLYTQPIFDIFKRNEINYHAYADDIQIYVKCQNNSKSLEDKKLEIETCMNEVKSWMNGNRLKLNESKTECLFSGHKLTLDKVHTNETIHFSLSLGASDVIPLKSVRNLGVFFDNELKMNIHVMNLCKSIYFNIKKISNVRRFITTDAAKKLAVHFVLSRIDYCNSLLYGANEDLLNKVQVAMNNAARVVLGKTKRESATQMLKDLHWLPVRERVQFKIASLCFNYFDNTLPSYLFDLLHVYQPTRTLRSSSDTRIFIIPKTNLKTVGQRAFSFAGPKVWNALPVSIRYSKTRTDFKKKLKTFYFSKIAEM